MRLWAGQRTRYSDWLRTWRSGDGIPVGARFSAPVQTGPGAHSSSCTMGNGSSSGVKSDRGGGAFDPSPPSSAVGHERLELYLYTPYGPFDLYRASVPVQGCTLPLLCMRLNPGLCRKRLSTNCLSHGVFFTFYLLQCLCSLVGL